MNASTNEAVAYPCIVRAAPEGQAGWVAEFPDVPGCYAMGATRSEAMAASEVALKRWLERAALLGIEPPAVGAGRGATGSLRLRVPRTIHRQVAMLSNDLRLSLNETVVQLLYKAVGRDFGQLAEAGFCSLRVADADNPDKMRRPRETRFDPDRKFTGTWLQRLPKPLHLQLAAWAHSEQVNLNVLITYALVRELERWDSHLNHGVEIDTKAA